jgi:hypothetical protein
MSRHLSPLLAAAPAVALALGACRADLPNTPPESFVIAVFDPTTGSIPLPNGLVLDEKQDANLLCSPPAPPGPPSACAQAELIQSFKDAGGFPSDQETAVTFDFVEYQFDEDGNVKSVAPDLDLSSFTPDTYFVHVTKDGVAGEVAMDPIRPGDYVKAADHGTLKLHHKGRLPWAQGNYAVLIRGGEHGVKTADGRPVYASQIFSLLKQNKRLSDPRNNGLLKAQLGSQKAANEQGGRLDEINLLWKPLAYDIADTRFPHEELAILATFPIQPAVTNVTIDPARGQAPLPIDLLRDPSTGKLSALAACTFAGSTLAADGTCPNPAAAGFLALDGFSTTGAILAPTSDLIDPTTVNASTLQLWDLSDAANPVQVDPSTLVLEPCEFTSSCDLGPRQASVIAIQPAGGTKGDPTSLFRSKPLKDNTDYAVVITTGVKDEVGKPIGPGTVAKILHFTHPVLVGGRSALSGVDDATAAVLEKMRLQLAPLFAKLASTGTDFSKIGIAYTFRTQTITSQANQLAALPYLPALALPADATAAIGAGVDPSTAFAKYGVDPSVPSNAIAKIVEFDITTLNALDPATGAFKPDPTTGSQEAIHVLMALPRPSAVPACTGALAAFGKCAPLMVFRHGLTDGRAKMLQIANTYAQAGMVTVAIDAAKHGDRSFCTPDGPAAQCQAGATCTTDLPAGAQADASPPGRCTDGRFAYLPVSASCRANPTACSWTGQQGIPAVSGNYLVSANLFRTRDTLRQDLIDDAQLVRAVAYVPSGAPPTGHHIFDGVLGISTALGGTYIIDPATVYYSGHSLGAIQGAANVATHPRIAKAAFTAPGGSLVDVFTNSPAVAAQTSALLASLGIQPGSSEYLQFLVVAKTVFDPADPINFVGHITHDTLPNLLGTGDQAPKAVIQQMAYCDQAVPNPWNFLYASNLALSPLPLVSPTFGTGTGQLELFVGSGFTPTPAALLQCSAASSAAVGHGFLLDWNNPARTQKAQTDIVDFLTTNTLPPSVQQN